MLEQDRYTLYRRIQDFAVEQLLWRVLYITHVMQEHPVCDAVENKLKSMMEKAEMAILSSNSQEDARRFAQVCKENNRLFIEYAKHVADHADDCESIRHQWQESTAEMGKLLTRLNPDQTNWYAMLRHSDDLLQMVIRDYPSGKYNTLTDVTPLLQRLAADMADYAAKGYLNRHNL